MKRLIISILVLFFLASFSLVPAYAQLPNLSLYQAADKTQYRLRLEEGKQYYMQTINEQQISDPTPAKEGTVVMTIGIGAKLDVSNIDANGNAQVTYTYKWVKVGIKATEEKVYDSSKKDSTVPPELQWFAPLLEESFSLTITPEGQISEIKDLDKVRSNVRQKLPPGPMKEIAMSSLNQWLDDQALRERIENSMAIYPDKPVGVGDSWSRNVAYSRDFVMILENTWTLKERKNGVAVIEVVSTIKPNPEAKPVEIGTQGATSNSEFTGNQQGLIEMQESTGLIINSKINQQMTGQTTIKNAGRPGAPDITHPMKIIGVVSMETSDWEKARSVIGTNAVAEEQPRRETPYSRPGGPQRRATTFARSAAQPYLIDDEEGSLPAQPRQDEQKRTKTLHDAARDGDIDQVQLLISKGADVNEKNRMGWTPLHTAVQNRRQALIELLIAKGADINATNNRGQTPLMAAIDIGQKDAVELLIAKGADVNVMGSRGDNALSLAKKRRNTEIVDLLLKHGAKEPSPQDLMGDRYYEEDNSYPGYEEQGTIRRGTRAIRGTRTAGQSPVQVDILADPNGIKARIRTFEGLEKALEEAAGKSQNEMHQWQQKRYDNRTLLIRTVQKQFEDEIGFIRKVAVEEKAKKTTEAIDSTLSGRQERFSKVSKELLAQKRDLRQTQPARGRGRARTSGRDTGGRGRTSQRGQPYGTNITEPLYGRGDVMPGTTRPQSTRRPSEEVDIETENEINQWLQADVEDKTNLAEAVHEQIWVEISSVRSVAVEEEAKKTTAAIDGVLLYRQMRFEALIQKMEEGQQALRQQTQDPLTRGRTSGRRSLQGGRRGATGVQEENIEQQNQSRTRRRR
ncbi:MAG: DUF6263 family protein [Planctomycetota bacterium]